MSLTIEKRCVVCGKDVGKLKRTKDRTGRYYCQPCYDISAATAMPAHGDRQTPFRDFETIEAQTPVAAESGTLNDGSESQSALETKIIAGWNRVRGFLLSSFGLRGNSKPTRGLFSAPSAVDTKSISCGVDSEATSSDWPEVVDEPDICPVATVDSPDDEAPPDDRPTTASEAICPRCASPIFSGSSFCVRCGVAIAIPNTLHHTPETSPFDCTVCGGSESMKVSAAYESGTSTISAYSTHAVFTGSFSVQTGFGTSTMSGVQQSSLASRVRPPQRERGGTMLGFIFAFFCLGLAILAGVAAKGNAWIHSLPYDDDNMAAAIGVAVFVASIIPTILITTSRNQRANSRFQRLIGRWNRQWLCTRCGHVFIPGESFAQ